VTSRDNYRLHNFAPFVRPEQGILSAMGIYRQPSRLRHRDMPKCELSYGINHRLNEKFIAADDLNLSNFPGRMPSSR